MAQYLPILLLLVLAIVFALIGRLANHLLAPKRPSIPKSAPYESGIVPDHETPERFPVKFFLVAMIFIVFDIEIIFLFPFAVVHRELGGFGIAAIVIFSAAVFESFVYLIGNGALDWGPVKRLRGSAVVSPARTLAGTVRRVGSEGRGEPVAEEVAA
jgi:NADH-quinone oxidoreductase subunit A